MSKENSELVISRLDYDIEKLKQFVYAAEQSEQEAVEIIAELKAENAKLKEKLEKIKEKINAHCAVCETMKRPKCDDCVLSWLLEIIKGTEDE